MGKMLNHAYQVFQVEVGLSGNWEHFVTTLLTISVFLQHTARVLLESVADIDCLVRNSGYMTHITSHSFVKMTEQSWSQSSVTDTCIFSRGELAGINRYRHFEKRTSNGNLVLCDGIWDHGGSNNVLK